MDDEWINQPRHQIQVGFLRFLRYINQPKARLLKLTEPTFQLPKKLRDWWILSWKSSLLASQSDVIRHIRDSWNPFTLCPVGRMIVALISFLRCGERGTWYPKQLPSLLLYKNQPAMVASQHRYLECFFVASLQQLLQLVRNCKVDYFGKGPQYGHRSNAFFRWKKYQKKQTNNFCNFLKVKSCVHMAVSENRGTPKSSILIELSIHFGVPLFLETPILQLHKKETLSKLFTPSTTALLPGLPTFWGTNFRIIESMRSLRKSPSNKSF